MSELRVDNIVDMGGSGAPQLRKGANVTGISTITQAVVGNATINAGGINATGIVTAGIFKGTLHGNITGDDLCELLSDLVCEIEECEGAFGMGFENDDHYGSFEETDFTKLDL